MAIVTFDHYKYTPEQALGADLVSRATDIHHNGDFTVTIEGVTQAEADEALSIHLLESAKSSKRGEINAWRSAQEEAGLILGGNKWDSDKTSFQRIMAVALAGAEPPTGYWTSFDNVDVPMTGEQLRELYAAMLTAGSQIHDRQRTMKTEVDALSDVAAVESYIVGWPNG